MTVTVANATERETISQIWWFKNFSKSLYIKKSGIKMKRHKYGLKE